MNFARSGSSRAQSEALVQLFAQLALAARAGLPLGDALRILGQDAGVDRASARMLGSVASHVAAGGSLSDGMRTTTAIFPPETITLVRQAEGTQALPAVLEMLAWDYGHRARFRTAVRAAMFWPATAFAVLLLVLIAVSFFVVPVYRDLFHSFDAELPAPTRAVMAIAEAIVRGWFLWIPLAIVGLLAWRRNRERLAQLRADALARLTPAMRTYLARTFTLRLSGILLASQEGAPLRESLAHLRATLGSRKLADIVGTLEQRIAEGMSIGQAVRATAELPPRLLVAVELGSRTDCLAAALRQVQALSEDDTERSLVRLEQFVLIAAYLIVGVLVGFTVIALYLPIFTLGSIL